jgi:hypothetical protein
MSLFQSNLQIQLVKKEQSKFRIWVFNFSACLINEFQNNKRISKYVFIHYMENNTRKETTDFMSSFLKNVAVTTLKNA